MDLAEKDRKEFLTREKQKHNSDRFIKCLLIVAIVYFGLHAVSALAQVVFMPDGTLVKCTPTSIGTVVCL